MRTFRRFGTIAFLDLITCGFGAAILLFHVAALAVPTSQDTADDETLLIRCRHLEGPKAEVGIEFMEPGSNGWVRPTEESAYYFAARSEPQAGAEAFLVVFSPKLKVGTWRFRPYLVDFPHGGATAEAVTVHFDVRGESVQHDISNLPARPMRFPGDSGQVREVRVLP